MAAAERVGEKRCEAELSASRRTVVFGVRGGLSSSRSAGGKVGGGGAGANIKKEYEYLRPKIGLVEFFSFGHAKRE